MPETPFPSHEEFQKKLQEFFKANFGDHVAVSSLAQQAPTDEPPDDTQKSIDPFQFSATPKQIKAHLDRYVIKQDEAKKTLSIAVCDHYNHVNRVHRLEKEDPEAANQIEYSKGNVLLLGPTGVGKTYLVKHVADLIGVPFVKADATKSSETGYVGGDVEDLVSHQPAAESRARNGSLSGQERGCGGCGMDIRCGHMTGALRGLVCCPAASVTV